jgi:WD40 repeat protein
MAFSPDGRYLAATGDPVQGSARAGPPEETPPRVVLHDATNLRSLRDMEGRGDPIAFTNDSAHLLVGGAEGARLYDVATGRLVRPLVPASSDFRVPVSTGAMHPDGRHVLVTPLLEEAWIFEIGTGDLVATICPEAAGRHVAVSPDAESVAIGHLGGVEVWDLEAILARGPEKACSGRERASSDDARVARFTANSGFGLQFSHNGELISTAGFDGVVGVWDATTGANRLRITHDGQVGGAAFSRDGRHLLASVNRSQGSLHSLQIYTLDFEELVTIARSKLTRGFTRDECRHYLQSPRCPGPSD